MAAYDSSNLNLIYIRIFKSRKSLISVTEGLVCLGICQGGLHYNDGNAMRF